MQSPIADPHTTAGLLLVCIISVFHARMTPPFTALPLMKGDPAHPRPQGQHIEGGQKQRHWFRRRQRQQQDVLLGTHEGVLHTVHTPPKWIFLPSRMLGPCFWAVERSVPNRLYKESGTHTRGVGGRLQRRGYYRCLPLM